MVRNFCCLFLVLLCFWFFLLARTDYFDLWGMLYGLISCLLVAYMAIKTGAISSKSSFLFLQLGFYRFFASIFGSFCRQSWLMALAFWHKSEDEFQLDAKYLWINREQDEAEIALMINTLNLIPGIAAAMVNRDKLVYFTLDNRFFSERDIELMMARVKEVNDEKLI